MTSTSQLTHLGFSENEARVYLTLIHEGRLGVSEVARRSDVSRTSCYHILDGLVAKRLISKTGKEPVLEYVAEHPRMLQIYIEKRSQDLQEKEKYAAGVSQQLATVYRRDSRPQVRFYEGKDGLEQVYEDTLEADPREGILAFAHVADMHKSLPKYFSKYYTRRASKGIGIRAILPNEPEAHKVAGRNKAEKRTSCFVDKDKYSFSPEINIYNNTVLIASWREELGITIESPEIADAMKKIYELAWLGAKSLEEKEVTSPKKSRKK